MRKKNEDGKFSGKECAMILSGHSYDISNEQQGVVGRSISVYNVQGYQAGDNSSILSKTLDDFVNEFISADKNLNGKVSLEDYITQTHGSLYNALKEKLSARENKIAEMFAETKVQPKKKTQKSKEEEAQEKVMELLAKIKQSRDIESLTADEKAVLKEYFAGEVEQLKAEMRKMSTNIKTDN